MDFLNNAYTQVVDLFRSMTPGARLTSGLLLIVVVVSVGYLFTSEMSGPSADLLHGVQITSNQLLNMEAAFGKAKLTGYKIDGMQIKVPRGQEAVYMAALANDNALPADFSTVMDDELKGGGMFDTDKDRDQRRKNAKEKKLGMVIGLMPGVDRATVLFDTDVLPGFKREKLITASVAVQPAGSGELDTEKVSKIRYFVAGSIAGLKPENVSVTDVNGRTWHGHAENGGGADDNIYVSLKRTNERDLKAKILNALYYVPNISVEATVTLDTKKNTRTHETKYDPKALVVRQSEQSTTRSQDSGGTQGRVGFAAQQPPNTAAALAGSGGGGSKEEEEQATSESISVASGQEIDTETVGLTPKLAKVSVGIPVSYFKKVWQERNPTAEGKDSKGPDQAALDQIRTEESAKIQKYVAQLLPQVEGMADPTELVMVTTFQDIPGKEIPAPGMAQTAMAWLNQYWSTLGMIGVVAISLLMLRSLIRSAPAPAETRAVPGIVNIATHQHQHLEDTSVGSAATAPVSRLKRFTGAGPSLRDELSTMVKEDPDTAANILRGWIGSAT
jgi:flagellar M-ring protein FliF